MTCENFITLCERGYYRSLPFHRIIKNFMVQASAAPLPPPPGPRGGRPFVPSFRAACDGGSS